MVGSWPVEELVLAERPGIGFTNGAMADGWFMPRRRALGKGVRSDGGRLNRGAVIGKDVIFGFTWFYRTQARAKTPGQGTRAAYSGLEGPKVHFLV